MAKTHSVQVPVSRTEYNKLRQDAAQAGVSTRELAKSRVLHGSETTTTAVVQTASSLPEMPVGTASDRPVNIYVDSANMNFSGENHFHPKT